MAYEMDALGNIIGEYESEEERRKREDEQASKIAHKQETITYANGDKTIKSTREIPASGPVSPDELYQRQLQAESGARQNNPATGQIMTSPRGALGIAQIMPSTAMNPGFGVPDIFTLAEQRGVRVPDRSEATARALLGNQALNQEFGQLYSNAMRDRFGEQAGVAAYNAGPGRVGANMAANQGQMNVAQLPNETQGYLDRVFRGLGNVVNAVIPSAQAGTLTDEQRKAQAMPQTRSAINPETGETYQQLVPVAPGQPPAQATQAGQPPATAVNPLYALSQGGSGLGIRAPGVGPQPEPEHPNKPYIDLYQQNQDNVGELWKIRNDPNAPQWLQERAGSRAYDLIDNQLKAKQAETQLKQMLPGLVTGDQSTTRDFMKTMADTGANYLKYLFLHLLNPELGKQYAIENLGVGSKWDTVTLEDGRNVEVKFNGAGRPIEGYDMNQKPLSKTDLLAAATGVLPKGVHVTKTETYIDPATRQVVTHQTLSNSKERFTMGGKTLPADFDKTKLVPEHQFTAAENKRVEKVVSDLNSKYPGGPTEAQKLGAMIAAGIPNVRIEQEMGLNPGTLGSATERTRILQGGARQAPGGAQGQTTTQQGPTTTFNTGSTEFRAPMPGESKESYAAAKKNFESVAARDIKQADEFGRVAITTRNKLEDLKQAVSAVATGKHYFGPMFGSSPQGGLASAGALPGVQEFFGGKFGDQTSMNNTTLMRSLMTREGLNGIKNSMGPSISNFDVDSWLKSNAVKETSSPEQLLQYFTRLHNELYDLAQKDKANAVKYGQLDPDFNFGNRLPDYRTNPQGEKKEKNKVDRDNPLLK